MPSKTKFSLTKIVLVSWRDATSQSKWNSKENYLAAEPSEILTVGFLLKQDKKTITVIMSQAEDDEMCASLSIPKDWCSKIKVLATFKPRSK